MKFDLFIYFILQFLNWSFSLHLSEISQLAQRNQEPLHSIWRALRKRELYSKVTSCFHMQVNLDYQVLKLKGDGLIPGLYFEPSSSLNHCYYSCVITPSLLLCRLFGRRKAFLGKYLLDHPLVVPSLSPLMPPAPVEMPLWLASWLERGRLAGPPRR